MKQFYYLLSFLFLIGTHVNAQTSKTFNGDFEDGRYPVGIAKFSYYEDPETREYIKNGAFSYVFEKGASLSEGLKEHITGNFVQGLKNGTWSYNVERKDYDPSSSNSYVTGNTSLVANYKNGYAHGTWEYKSSTKERKKEYSFGSLVWGEFKPVHTVSMSFSFKDGYIVGPVNINDSWNFKAHGSYDQQSLCTSTWTIDDPSFKQEFIYKNNILYEYLVRDNSGKVSEHLKFTEEYEMATKPSIEEMPVKIDTTTCGNTDPVCSPTRIIESYLFILFNKDLFLYDYIGGDLSYNESRPFQVFKGGKHVFIRKVNFKPLSEIDNYNRAEKLYNEGEIAQSLFYYQSSLTAYQAVLSSKDMKLLSNKVETVNKLVREMNLISNNAIYIKAEQLYDAGKKIEALENYEKVNSSLLALPEQKLFLDKIEKITKEVDENVRIYADNYERVKTLFDKQFSIIYREEEYIANYTFADLSKNAVFLHGKNYKIINNISSSCLESSKTISELSKCLSLSGNYNPGFSAIINQYYSYLATVNDKKSDIAQRNYRGFLISDYDSSEISKIFIEKEKYELAKKLINAENRYVEKISKIFKLNDNKSKPLVQVSYGTPNENDLLSKCKIVIEDFVVSYIGCQDMLTNIQMLKTFDKFLDKVISIYSSGNVRAAEKRLKKLTEVELIKQEILNTSN